MYVLYVQLFWKAPTTLSRADESLPPSRWPIPIHRNVRSWVHVVCVCHGSLRGHLYSLQFSEVWGGTVVENKLWRLPVTCSHHGLPSDSLHSIIYVVYTFSSSPRLYRTSRHGSRALNTISLHRLLHQPIPNRHTFSIALESLVQSSGAAKRPKPLLNTKYSLPVHAALYVREKGERRSLSFTLHASPLFPISLLTAGFVCQYVEVERHDDAYKGGGKETKTDHVTTIRLG